MRATPMITCPTWRRRCGLRTVPMPARRRRRRSARSVVRSSNMIAPPATERIRAYRFPDVLFSWPAAGVEGVRAWTSGRNVQEDKAEQDRDFAHVNDRIDALRGVEHPICDGHFAGGDESGYA